MMKSVTKEKGFHVLKMVLLAVTVTLVLLSLLGTVAHASGLVDDTVNADNLYSKYPECTFTLAEHFRKKKLTKTNVKELLEGKETLVKGIKTKDRKSYNAVVKIGEKGYIDFISFSK